MNKISLSLLLAACVSATVGAAPKEVSSVEELMSAVNNASANDEIVVKASGSPYEFASSDFDTVAHLYAKVRITLRGETGNPDDVILVGNANRILYLSQDGNTIRDLTFKNGDCRNYSTRTEDPKDQLRGGAVCSPKAQDSTTVISNCVFDSCRASAGGGACGTVSLNNVYFGKYQDCVFKDNMTSSGSGGAVYQGYSFDKCVFSGNSAAGTASNGGAVYGASEITGSSFSNNALTDEGSNSSCGGGAVYLPANTKYSAVTIANCLFSANHVCGQYGGAIRGVHSGLSVEDCVFCGNSAVSGHGGAVYGIPVATSCVFSNNCTTAGNGGALAGVSSVTGCTIVSNATSSTKGYGGGVYDCSLSGCYLASNYAYRCGAAADSRLRACTNVANSAADFYEFGPASGGWGCYAEDCVFDNSGYNNKRVFGSSGFSRCRFSNVRNGSRLFTTYVAMTNSLVANSHNSFTLFYNLTGQSDWINCTIVSNVYVFAAGDQLQNVLNAKNCLFYGNKAGDDNVDIDGTASSVVSSFNSCILSAASDAYIPGSNNLNYYGSANFKPGFVGIDFDQENPYAITTRSPAYKKDGIVEGWMATATDIRGDGFARLRDGRVNIGCYQCWLKIPGFCLIVR